MQNHCKRTNIIVLNIFLGLGIIFLSCSNNPKHQFVLDENVDIKIFCDSINIYPTDILSIPIYFHLDNYSDNDAFISFNNELDTISKKSLIFITTEKDTIPIWYFKRDLGINMFERRSKTFFVGIIDIRELLHSYEHNNKYKKFSAYLKDQIALSEIIYIPDRSKFINNPYNTYDTLISIKGKLNVDIKNTVVLFRPPGNLYEFITKKL